MNILVTGHEGYIGSLLVPRLLGLGHSVTGCDTGFYRDCHFIGELADVPNIDKDIRELDVVDLTGFDALIHLAGLSNDPLGSYRPELTLAINEQASVKLAETSSRAGVTRFLFASSCSIYGATAGEELLDENSPPGPITPYAVSKHRAEIGIGALASADFSPVFLRAGTVYGVSPRIRFDLVLNNLVAWAVATGRIHLKSDGMAWRPLIHVEDLVECYVLLLDAPRERIHNQAYNAGVTAHNHRIHELAEIIGSVVQGSRIEYAADADADARNYRADCEKIRHLPGWRDPRWSVRDGASQLYEALTARPVDADSFEGAGFSRIAHVKLLMQSGMLDQDLYWRRTPRPEGAATGRARDIP